MAIAQAGILYTQSEEHGARAAVFPEISVHTRARGTVAMHIR